MRLHLCAVLLFVSSCTAREIPALTETTHNYETVYPRIVQSSRDTRSAAGGDPEIKVVIDSINETLTLHLKLNEHLVSPSFTSIHYDEDGNEIITNGHADCFYQGVVEEHPSWSVIMNACGGLKGVFGDWTNRTQYYHLKPFNHSDPSLEQGHMLIPDSEYKTENGTCGTVGHGDTHSITEDLESLAEDIERVRRQSPTGDYIVELAIVNDNRQYNSLNRDLSLTVKNAIDVVNVADSIFKVLSVRLVITHVVTWTSGDRISVVSDPNTLLENFRSYRSQVNQPHDAFFLLTGRDLSGNTVGIAYLNTMCGSASVGLVQDGSRSTSSTGSTFAHELGHVFSLEHDTNGCSCSDRSGRCVMAAVSSFPAPEQWSSCSRSQIQTALSRRSNNLGRCLENEPTTTVGEPVCGNGIREGDEICDCGSPQECDDPCCDARTCRMAAGAQCTRGACCTDTCQFKVYGTSCRSSSGQCDIEEYCTGESSECPADVYKQDGTSCNNNQAYCFSGECQTYDDQCQYHFGSNMGVTNCYDAYNPQGTVFGNCGYTSTDYIPCSQSNARCGQLFCNPGQYQNRVSGVRVTIVTVRLFVNSVLRECQGFTPEPGTDMISPGLVNDGTKCRDGHLCFEQECIPVNNLNVPKCRVINGQICSGRGVCNNRGQCSCNVGFVGSNCETATTGPSIDECAAGLDNCDQGCVNTEESYFCTCNDGYRLAADGHTCLTDCGGRLTTASGSFQTPGWPQNYPQEDFQCEWIIELPNTGAVIEFTIDDSAYGINGRSPCTNDYIQFFDGTGSNANSLERLCQFINPGPITTTSSRARVVFAGTENQFRPASRVGVKVDYRTVTQQANECQNNNGGCEQICVNTAQSFECRCEEGYQLDGNGRSCSDINECNSNNGGCQHNCVNTDGSYVCQCRSGYRLSSNGRTCTDINECSLETHNCAQVCTNTAGSFTCSCNSGFTLAADGRSCTEELRCGGTLTGASGSFQTPGWPQNYPQEDFQCEWIIQLPNSGAVIEFTIDDSAYGINGRSPCSNDYIEFFDGTGNNADSLERLCQFMNPGPITTTSSRARVVFAGTENRFRPASRVGVKVDYRTVTQQENECQNNNGGCEQICINTAQSFECRCEEGYQLDGNGRSCSDINECSSNNGGCQHNCVNTDGSFVCQCRSGYRLSSNGRSCTDINECSEGTHNCAQVCTNTAGSFTCSCNNGFTLAADGRSCTEESRCGGTLTGASGSFQTPGWPQNYPQENFQCEWIIQLPDSGAVIEFTIDDSAYGINGRSPCTNDYIEFFDGTGSNADSLERLCQFMNPGPITTTSSRARVVFAGTVNRFRPASRVGVKVDYRTIASDQCDINNGGCDHICVNDGQCQCFTGYRLGSDGRRCNDINECSSNNGGCQHNCVNTDGSYECQCRSGYRLSSDGKSCSDINECLSGTHNCAQVCTNTAGSFTCSCNSGSLAADGRSCTEEGSCGGRLTGASGSFQTPGWPQNYPQEDLQCEWIIDLPDAGTVIEFTIDDSAYGISGRPPCTRDHIEFFDGTDSDADSLAKLCKFENPGPITTTSSQARVVFTGFINQFRPASRVGVRVTYRAIQPEEGLCGGRLTEASGSFNSPGWPLRYPQEDFQCVWIIELPNTGSAIEFTIDDSAYGINGRSPCPTDYIEFFDGTSSSFESIVRLCQFNNPGPITTTASRARVVFSGSINPHRPRSRVGVKVNYRTV